ncbi:DUF58 domain-containing protein [Adhaeretor mobilis]|uniref:VWFA domain-containing protein n=1 Tax=Adhaeretor mobilis TaxID=1930276 RepID=A0A517MQR6_9BACT|nr:DUF58 domain-containing protein [Adhaeretor mobilis]QDS97223.1 hypothetical protein HG15A2_04840 [Adhaeretor mobilis]
MRLRPGANLIRAILGLAVLSPLTFVVPQAAWVLLFGTIPLAAFAIREVRLLRSLLSKVEVSRRQTSLVGRDTPFLTKLVISNQSEQELLGVVRDVLPNTAIPDYSPVSIAIPPHGIATTTTQLRIPERGRYELGPVWLRAQGPWKLLEAQKDFDCRASIKILPETFVSKEGLSEDQRAQLLMLDKITRARQNGAGTEFESLSEFRHGDDPRRIDWRTTARLGHPIVRRYQVERHRDVMIIIDCGRLMGAKTSAGTKLDCAIDSALMLAEVALRHGDRCGVGYFDNQVRGYRAPLSGVSSVHSMADSIYDLQSEWRESDFGAMFAELQLRQSRRSLIVLLSDIVDVETSTRFRTSLARLAQKHVLLFAALRTPLLEQVVHSPVSSLLDGSRQAVAFELLQQRQKALHSLRHSGIQVLDVEPSDLTVPLINEFIELRCQNLL